MISEIDLPVTTINEPSRSPSGSGIGFEQAPSIELLQVHAGIEAGDLISVAVEHEGRAALHEDAAFADAPFGGLAPARMIDRRVHVGIEAVLAWGLLVPSRRRLLLDQGHADDRLDALETVFPGH